MPHWWSRLLQLKSRRAALPDPDINPAMWVSMMLQREDDAIYEVSRTEPFRLRDVRTAHESPVTPGLINHTMNTVIGIVEPEQFHPLARALTDALRAVTVDCPKRVTYRSRRHGEVRLATIIDLGPDHPHLYIHCQRQDEDREAIPI